MITAYKKVLRTTLNCLALGNLINWLITVKVIVEVGASPSQCHNLGAGGRAIVSEKERFLCKLVSR